MSQAHTYSAQILLLPNGCDKISEAAEESFLFFITNTGKITKQLFNIARL